MSDEYELARKHLDLRNPWEKMVPTDKESRGRIKVSKSFKHTEAMKREEK